LAGTVGWECWLVLLAGTVGWYCWLGVLAGSVGWCLGRSLGWESLVND